MPHPQRFTGESIVSWSDLDITISVPWYLGLMFRTRKEDGVLMEATAGTSSKLHLQVSVSAEQTGALEITRQEGVSRAACEGHRLLTSLLLRLAYKWTETSEGKYG